MLHALQRFQEGEIRQVFAAYRDGRPELFYLPEGGTDTAVKVLTRERLRCPIPDCPSPGLVAIGGTRRHHFRHGRSSEVRHAPESLSHITAKGSIARWVRGRYPDATVIEEHATNAQRDRIADVLVTFPGDRRVAIEVQYAALTVEQWQERHDSYARQDIRDVWLFGHTGDHFKLADRGQRLRLNAVHLALLAADSPVLWFNPFTNEIASVAGLTAGDNRATPTVEPLAHFTLSPDRGLTSQSLESRLAEIRRIVTQQQVETAAAQSTEQARPTPEAEALKVKQELQAQEAATRREALLEAWRETADYQEILERFDGLLPVWLNVTVKAGALSTVPGSFWQAHLLREVIDPVDAYGAVSQDVAATALRELSPSLTLSDATAMVTAWYEALVITEMFRVERRRQHDGQLIVRYTKRAGAPWRTRTPR